MVLKEESQIQEHKNLKAGHSNVQVVCLLSIKLLTLLKELFRRFKISRPIPVRIPLSLKLIGPVKPLVLTCL